MKVLPSLLRKGKGPFLKPRSGNDQDSKRDRVLSPRNDGSFPRFPTAVQDENTPILANPEQPNIISNNKVPAPSSVILPTVSYSPFSDEPSDDRPPTPTSFNMSRQNAYNISPDRRDQMWYKNQMYLLQKEQQDMRSKNSTGYGVNKYYDDEENRSSRQKYFESQERPAGSFDRHDQKTPSSGGMEEFESLNKFQGLKHDGSLLGIQKHSTTPKNKESVSRLLSLAKSNDDHTEVFVDDQYAEDTSEEYLKHGILSSDTHKQKPTSIIKDSVSKLLSLVKSNDEEGIFADDQYTEADTCDIEFSRDEDDGGTTLFSEISGLQESCLSGVSVTQASTHASSTLTDPTYANSTGECTRGSSTQDDATPGNPALDIRNAGEDGTTKLFDCEYDTQEESPWALPMHLRVEQEHAPNMNGDTASQMSYSQFDDEESMTSSYYFQFVDDGTHLFQSRRKKVKKFRASRKVRSQQLKEQVPGQASASEADNTSILRSGKYVTQPIIDAKDPSTDDNEHTCCLGLPSLSKIKEDVKVTYSEATNAWNQVMYAFFITEDDVNVMANKIRGAQFNKQSKAGTF